MSAPVLFHDPGADRILNKYRWTEGVKMSLSVPSGSRYQGLFRGYKDRIQSGKFLF
jgi:hypothetical protein